MLYNVPVIVTPLPFLEEYGIEDGKNCYILKFDCSNVDDIAKKIAKFPKFKMKLPEDIYGKLLAPGKSTYKQQINSRYIVEATSRYMLTNTSDNELCAIRNVENNTNNDRYVPEPGEQWETSYSRKEILYRQGFIKVIKEIPINGES